MYILIRDETSNVRTADVDPHVTRVVIGSHPECHVYLPDIRIAEQHYLLERDAESWWLRRCPVPDDSAAQYTRLYVNALEATEDMQIKHNDEILVARFTLQVFTNDANANAPRAAVLAEAERIRAHPLPPCAIVRAETSETIAIAADLPGRLAEFAFAIHDCRDLATLLAAAIAQVARQFKARQVWMGTRRHGYGRLESVETHHSNGRTSGDPPRLETYTYRCGERGQYICCPDAAAPGTTSVMAIPLAAGPVILGVLYVDNGPDDHAYTDEDLDLLTLLGAVIARQLELIVREQLKHQEAVAAGELSFMRELQSVMDPSNAPQWEGLQLAVYCRPGLDSAGDIYDMMRLPNGLAAFLCGHVAGSPTVGALAMAEVRAAFRIAGLHADPPHILQRALNWLLFDPTHPAALSCVGVVMNPKTGAMQYSSAGRMGAVVIGARGDLRSLVDPSIPEVGAQKDAAFNSQATRLEDGETMVLYSPGCLSVTNPNGEQLGKRRFLEGIADAFGQTASAALNDLLSDLRAFFKDGRQPDDITIMVLHRE